ncbi:uncharacterized protein [Prorops nasuta]|uniref:uncharacterized protein n=1 Tax=Prorops nasuta TaxID=863751 RepID=UPI0034CE0A4C
MLYALVQWTIGKQITILNQNHFPKKKKIAEKTKINVRYGKIKYEATVIKISEDEEYLKKFGVTTSGKIFNEKLNKCAFKPKKNVAKRISLKKYRKSMDFKNDSKHHEILNLKPIYSNHESDIPTAVNDSDNEFIQEHNEVQLSPISFSTFTAEKLAEESITNRDLDDSISNNAIERAVSDEDFENSAADNNISNNAIETDGSDANIQNPATSNHTNNTRNTAVLINIFKKLLKCLNVERQEKSPLLKKLINQAQFLVQQSEETEDDDKIELWPASAVYVSSADLAYIKLWSHKPNEMVRRLLKNIIDPEKLKNYSARGKGGKEGVPEHIIKAVECFVKKHAAFPLKRSQFTRTVNLCCSSIRNPRREKEINSSRRD